MFLRLKIKNVCICERAPWSGKKKLVFVILVQLFAARERARKPIFFLLYNPQRHTPKKTNYPFYPSIIFLTFYSLKTFFSNQPIKHYLYHQI